MCNEQAQKQYAPFGGVSEAGIAYAGVPNYSQADAGAQVLSSPGSKPSSDPMWMPLQGLINEWHRQTKELSYLRIELANQKVRVAELERDRALRIG